MQTAAPKGARHPGSAADAAEWQEAAPVHPAQAGTMADWQGAPCQTARDGEGDGAYAAINLIQRCQQLPQPVKLVSRLRLDAQLYDGPPLERPKGSRGPKPKKGERQPQLAERLVDPQTQWQTMTLPWYAEGMRCLEYVTGTSLWHRPGESGR